MDCFGLFKMSKNEGREMVEREGMKGGEKSSLWLSIAIVYDRRELDNKCRRSLELDSW